MNHSFGLLLSSLLLFTACGPDGGGSSGQCSSDILVGDLVIKDTSEILRRAVRTFDICTRFGGEEFAIVMPSSTLQAATNVAERIRQRIERYRPAGVDTLRMTASVGIAMSGPDKTTRDLIARADEALYLAKRAGKNQVRAID